MRVYALLVKHASPRSLILAVLASCWLAPAQPAPSPTRGQLLYETHCVECHNAQVHWRAGRKARNWATLKAQVVRWKEAARLGWDDADVSEVTRYLNEIAYRFPPPQAARRTRVARAG